MTSIDALSAPHGDPADLVADALGVVIEQGLDEKEADARRRQNGPNSLNINRDIPIIRLLARQFASIVVWLLVAAAFIAWFTDSRIEAIAIGAVLIINAVIGLVIEWKADRTLNALHRQTTSTALVRRGGRERSVNAEELVAGDVILLNAGDRVPADTRLIEAPDLRVNESTFTGESTPVTKTTEPVQISSILAERRSMVFLGTLITGGRALGVVTATGNSTELGRVAHLVAKTEQDRTPLEKRLQGLGKILVYVVLAVAAIVMAAGVARGDDPWLMAMIAISLAVAAVPEALPAMTTLILALGVLDMARHRAIVRRLASVETLGSTTVICADKTGTLTENRMTVTAIRLSDGTIVGEAPTLPNPLLARLITVAVLCNDALPTAGQESEGSGDPTEIALLDASVKAGFDALAIRAQWTKRCEEPFSPISKRMITVHEKDHAFLASLKGGSGVVLSMCGRYVAEDSSERRLDAEQRARLSTANDLMAAEGLRVLAFADRTVPSGNLSGPPQEGYVFLGYIGMTDPPRAGVRKALRDASGAGIRVIMLTGDQLPTATAIARTLDLGEGKDVKAVHASEIVKATEQELRDLAESVNVFARVSPEEKLRIVEALQSTGEIVAVTGDGINDAPALRRADIGIAMGSRGTEVAKEASDIVLTDDDFSTIVLAIRGGRTIYANIIKFVHMLFSHNLGEVIFIFGALVLNMPLPLLPLQILWINIVTDISPALALAVEPSEPGLMKRAPRRSSRILSGSFMLLIAWQGAMMAVISLLVYAWALGQYGDGEQARMVAMLSLIGVQTGHLLNCRSRTRSAFHRFFSNKYILISMALTVSLQVLALCVGPLRSLLGLTIPNFQDIAVALSCVVWPVLIVEIAKRIARTRRKPRRLVPA